MKKAIIIVLFFCSLFIGKEAFASSYFDLNISSNGDFFIPTYNQLDLNLCSGMMLILGPVDNISMPLHTSSPHIRNIEEASINNCNNYIASRWSGGGDFDNYKSSYVYGTDQGNYWLIFGGQYESSSQNIIDFNLYTGVNYSNGVWSDITSPLPEISSITPSYPVNTTIEPPENVNQIIKTPVTLTGNYINIDEYNYILVYGLDEGVLGREYVLCESDIGESGEYSCSVDFWTNKTYNYEMIMTKTPIPSSPSVSSGVMSFSVGLPFTPLDDILTSDEEECETTDLFCHLKNAVRWGFIPEKETFYSFVSLSNKIMERAPFGYAKIIYQKLENLQIDETNNIELVSLEAIDEMIYNPFRVAFSYILYFVFVVGLYFRFRNINI